MPEPPQVTTVNLVADSGFEVGIADLGATIVSLRVPVDDERRDVVLAYDDPSDYVDDPYYLGATLGRYANRIRGGHFVIEGDHHQLVTQPEHHGHTLHGGPDGFSRQRFQIDRSPDGRNATCRFISSHGEGGFPGRLDVAIGYQLLGDSTLAIDYTATADRKTIVNLSNHAYFNLDGNGGSIRDHELAIFASRYTPVDATLIPTGEVSPVEATPLDLRTASRLGPVIDATGGLDTNYVIDHGEDDLQHAARLVSSRSGLCLDVLTTQPGLQVFTGQNLQAPFRPFGGVCLETQNFPDAPNQPHFPSATLQAGEIYRQRTVYAFSVLD